MTTNLTAGPARPSSTWPAGLALVIVLTAFAASRLSIAGIPSEREYDEGVYLLSGRAVAAGHALFAEVFSSQPPAFVETLAFVFRHVADSLAAARGVILVFALVSLTAVSEITRRIAGAWAAPAAAAALALSATFTDLSHVVEAESPAIALSLLAMAVCLAARRRGWNRGWLIASGALFATAALYKLIVAPLAAPFGLLLLLSPADSDESTWRLDADARVLLARCAWVALGAAVVLGLPLLFYDARLLYEQAIGFHLDKHEVFTLNATANLRRAVSHLGNDAVLVASGGAGLLLLVARAKSLVAAWLAVWMVAMLAAISLQTPLFWRHFVLLSPPVAIAAAAGAVFAVRTRAALVTTLAIAAWTGTVLHADRGIFPHLSDGARNDRSLASLEKTAHWIRLNTTAEEIVVSDDPLAVYLGGRGTAPGLCDTSSARIVAESLRVEDAARETVAARVIILRNGGRLSYLPGFYGWLARNYEKRPNAMTGLGTTRTVWIRKKDATAAATNPASNRFRDTGSAH